MGTRSHQSREPGAAWLALFLGAPTEPEAQHHLGRLLADYARPLVRAIVAGRMELAPPDRDDLVAETLTALLRRFRAMRDAGAPTPIADVRGYVAAAAHSRCNERFRQLDPSRNRLAKRVRYLMAHRPELATWRGAHGEVLCGLRRDAAAAPARPSRRAIGTVEKAVFRVLERARDPISFAALVEGVADETGTREPREIAVTECTETLMRSDGAIEGRLAMRDVRRELLELPRSQRAALMLNLRDPADRAPVSLVPLTGAGKASEIAAMLALPPEQVAAIWDEIPLDDRRIASLLGVTRREVVKLRRLARERLRRRWAPVTPRRGTPRHSR